MGRRSRQRRWLWPATYRRNSRRAGRRLKAPRHVKAGPASGGGRRLARSDFGAADVRYLKNGCAAALRQLRDRLTVQRSGLRPDGTAQVLGGINGQSIARRLTAAASAAGIEGRITGHSGRVGLAVELTRRGAPEQGSTSGGKQRRGVRWLGGGTRWGSDARPAYRRRRAARHLAVRCSPASMIPFYSTRPRGAPRRGRRRG